MTFYTAIGKYEFRKDTGGDKVPVIIAEDREYTLDICEMILWCNLIWNIHTYDEISKIFYKKEREAHVLSELSCETYIDRLESVGLIVSGHGITAVDALHDLLSRLYIIPVKATFVSKNTPSSEICDAAIAVSPTQLASSAHALLRSSVHST